MHHHPHQHQQHHPSAHPVRQHAPTPGHYDPRRLPPVPHPTMMGGYVHHPVPHAASYPTPPVGQRPPGLGVYVGQPVWTPEVPTMMGVEGPERSLMEWLLGDGVFPVGLKRLHG